MKSSAEKYKKKLQENLSNFATSTRKYSCVIFSVTKCIVFYYGKLSFVKVIEKVDKFTRKLH